MEDYLSPPAEAADAANNSTSGGGQGQGRDGGGAGAAPRNNFGNFDVPSVFPGRGVQYHLGRPLSPYIWPLSYLCPM